MQQNEKQQARGGQSDSGSTRQRQEEQQQKQRAETQKQPGQQLSTKDQQQIDRDHLTDGEEGGGSS